VGAAEIPIDRLSQFLATASYHHIVRAFKIGKARDSDGAN